MSSDLSTPSPNTGSVACPTPMGRQPCMTKHSVTQLLADDEPHKPKLQRSEILAAIIERGQPARYGEGSL